jgi:hypothetical protein
VEGAAVLSAFEAWDNRSFTVSRPSSGAISPVSFEFIAPLALAGIASRWRAGGG